MFRAFVSTLGATSVALVVMAVPAPAATDIPTINVSDSTVVLGRKVTVSGEGPALRTVVLQVRTDENGWQRVASKRTGLAGTYSFTAPDWVGTHKLRIVVTGTLLSGPETSDVRTVTVKMPYRPPGRATDWSWISHRGARWEPCNTITYRINPRGGYSRATDDIRRTFRSVGMVTGFRFKYLGTTNRAIRRGHYGGHPASTDVLVDWQGPSEDSGLSGDVAGIGGHWVLDGERFDGFVLLDKTQRLRRTTWRQLLAHEIGHVLGLGHADSPNQLMYGVVSSRNRRWGEGDLAALRRVGASRGCLSTSANRAGPGTGATLVSAS